MSNKISKELMAKDEAVEAVSMEELEETAKENSGIKYQNIIDTLHQLKLSDDDIKNLPADTIDTLNAYGALSEASKRLFTKEYEEAEAKRDMLLIDFLTTHKDPFKELYEAAIKK